MELKNKTKIRLKNIQEKTIKIFKILLKTKKTIKTQILPKMIKTQKIMKKLEIKILILKIRF